MGECARALRNLIAREGSAARDALVLADNLPTEVRTAIRNGLSKYLHFVEVEEWPEMAEARAVWRQSPPGLPEAMTALITFAPHGSGQELVQRHAMTALEHVLEARRDRIVLSREVIAPIQWVIIGLLDALMLLTIGMVHLERPATVAINLFTFSTAIAACLVLLMVNDRPFSGGGITIDPGVLHEIRVE